MSECEHCGKPNATRYVDEDVTCEDCADKLLGAESEEDPLAALKGYDHWVEWGVEDPPNDKAPYSPIKGWQTGHSMDKSDEWGSYEDVESGNRGFVITGTDIWGVDFDDVSADEEGLTCEVEGEHDCDIELAEEVAYRMNGETYGEYSPSGDGVHLLAEQASRDEDFSYKGKHLEVYTTDRYFTVTEDETDGSPGSIEQFAVGRISPVIEDHKSSGLRAPSSGGISVSSTSDDAMRGALEHVSPDADYNAWLRVLFAIHSHDDGEDGLEMAKEWSAAGEKYDSAAESTIEDVWSNRDPDGGVGVGTLFYYAMENGWEPPSGTFEADWDRVVDAFADDDIAGLTARDYAYRALDTSTEFLAMRDTELLWRYEESDGVFRQDGAQYVAATLEENVGAFYSRSLKQELIDRLKSANWADRDELGASLVEPLIACDNAVVNMQTGETHEHSPEHKLMSKVDVEYDPEAECPEIDAFLEERLEGDQDRIDSFWEAVACALAPGMPIDNFVIMHGPPGTGKSTMIKIIEALVGDENASSEGLHRLAHDNHAMAGLYGKKANLAGDMDGGEITRTRLLLQLSGGDTVTANPKNETPFQFEPTAEMVFSTNELPEFTSNLDPIARRLVPIEVPIEIPLEDHEPMHEVMARLASDSELSGALNRALEAYPRLLRQSEFSVNEGLTLEQRREKYKLLEDPVEQFLQQMVDEDPTGEVPKQQALDAYIAWAKNVGAKPLDKGQLTTKLTERDYIDTSRPTAEKIGLTGDRERVRCYSGIRLNPDGQAAADRVESRDPSEPTVADYKD